jgi:endoglucanase
VTRGFALVAVLVWMIASPVPGLGSPPDPGDGTGDWWDIPYPETFDASRIRQPMSFIRVEGNSFVDEGGNAVVFQGVNISDPDKLEKDGYWNKHHFEVIKEWGADIVRVPVHPIAWKGRGEAAYFELLDQAVEWASELGLYLIIEWHAIGNLETGVFQHPMHQTSESETYQFWRGIAHRYAGVPTIAFYELFNEPTTYRGQLGTISWQEWKEINEQIIGIIYAHDTRVIPLVGGFDWAYELRSVGTDPIEAEGIGYVSHPYPMKVPQPWEENWERDFGYVADTYPVFATEIGFMSGDAPGAHVPVISDETYGRRVTEYFSRKGISWTAWCFDPDWPPQLISDWEYTPTQQGAFFKAYMQGKGQQVKSEE